MDSTSKSGLESCWPSLGPTAPARRPLSPCCSACSGPTPARPCCSGARRTTLTARRGVGVMMQEVVLPDALWVHELISMTQAYYPDPLTLAEAIALAGVEKIAARPYVKLSGGQKRQAQFALAICGRPRLQALANGL